jgi:hypothetical protein
MTPARMVAVTSVTDPMTARILAARLGAEGIVWELRGGDGLYPVGPVVLLVEEQDVGVARALLGEAAAEEDEWRALGDHGHRRRVAIAALLVALLMTLTFGRYLVEAMAEPSPPDDTTRTR